VAQLWLFWLAPLIGAVVAGLVTRWLHEPVLVTESVMVVEKSEVRI
jgi:aquaporin Z